nr:hypothetical protein [Tanacetum cinerariifolium]
MALTFADTHNMIAYLTKSDASEGFNQIIDFLNSSAIKYALTVNPNIYVLCIKQFLSSVSVKKVIDVTRLQALIDRKKVIITEATVREVLRLDDAESIDCLPNEEIFTELSRMGYGKPSTKLTFYKAFFLPRWNFLIHIILQCMSAKRTSWNEFSSSMASTVICLSIVSDLSSHTIKYSSPALTQKVFANMRRVGKGISRVETPLFEGMIVAQQADDVADKGVAGVNVDDVPTANAEPTLPSPTPTTQPPPPSQELPSTSQVIPTPPPSPIAQPSSPPQQPQPSQPTHNAEISLDLLHTLLETCTTLTMKVEALEQDKVAQALEIINLKQRVKKLERKNKLKVSGLRRLRKVGTTQRVESSADTVMNINWDDVIEQVQRKEKEDNVVLRYQALKRKPQTEAQARKNMMIYLRNMAGFKMYYFKRMSYNDIRPIFEKYFNSNVAFLEKTKEHMEEDDIKALKRKTESFEEKAVKKQKLDEEVEELKKHLQIVPNNEDDVYIETTSLALKMFEKPNVEAQVWKSQRGVYGLAKVKSWRLLESCGVHIITLTTTQMILLVERRYPLTSKKDSDQISVWIHPSSRSRSRQRSSWLKKKKTCCLTRLQGKYAKGLRLLVEDLMLLVQVDVVERCC